MHHTEQFGNFTLEIKKSLHDFGIILLFILPAFSQSYNGISFWYRQAMEELKMYGNIKQLSYIK